MPQNRLHQWKASGEWCYRSSERQWRPGGMEGLPGGGGACPGSLTIGRIRIKWRFGERAFQVGKMRWAKVEAEIYHCTADSWIEPKLWKGVGAVKLKWQVEDLLGEAKMPASFVHPFVHSFIQQVPLCGRPYTVIRAYCKPNEYTKN